MVHTRIISTATFTKTTTSTSAMTPGFLPLKDLVESLKAEETLFKAASLSPPVAAAWPDIIDIMVREKSVKNRVNGPHTQLINQRSHGGLESLKFIDHIGALSLGEISSTDRSNGGRGKCGSRNAEDSEDGVKDFSREEHNVFARCGESAVDWKIC